MGPGFEETAEWRRAEQTSAAGQRGCPLGWAVVSGGHLHCQWSRATGDGWAGLCVSGVCQTGTVRTRRRGGGHGIGSCQVREPHRGVGGKRRSRGTREGRSQQQGLGEGREGTGPSKGGRRQAGASTSEEHHGPERTPKPARDPKVPLRELQKWAPQGMRAGQSPSWAWVPG